MECCDVVVVVLCGGCLLNYEDWVLFYWEDAMDLVFLVSIMMLLYCGLSEVSFVMFYDRTVMMSMCPPSLDSWLHRDLAPAQNTKIADINKWHPKVIIVSLKYIWQEASLDIIFQTGGKRMCDSLVRVSPSAGWMLTRWCVMTDHQTERTPTSWRDTGLPQGSMRHGGEGALRALPNMGLVL